MEATASKALTSVIATARLADLALVALLFTGQPNGLSRSKLLPLPRRFLRGRNTSLLVIWSEVSSRARTSAVRG